MKVMMKKLLMIGFMCSVVLGSAMAQTSFTDQVMRLSLGDALEAPVQFEKGSSKLTQQSLTLLEGVASQMNSEGNIRFEIEGHTDMSGSYNINRKLSEQRAAAVAYYLVSLGVDQSKLVAKGYAYDRLLPDLPMNDPEHRRVMFKRVQ